MLRVLLILLAVFFIAPTNSYAKPGKKPAAAAKKVKGKKSKATDKWALCCKQLEAAGHTAPSGTAYDYVTECIKSGDAEALKVVIDADCAPGDTAPLIALAITEGKDEIAKMLMKTGGTLNSPQSTTDPLIAAIDKNNVAMIKALLEAGANPDEVVFDHQSRFSPRDHAKRCSNHEISALFPAK